MTVQELIGNARDTLTVKRVFGEPYERDGVTIIPAASIKGGGGGGGDKTPGGGGEGAGFGLIAKPAGAYVIRDGNVRWEPALDLNRTILGGQVIALVGLIVLRSVFRKRAKARRKR